MTGERSLHIIRKTFSAFSLKKRSGIPQIISLFEASDLEVVKIVDVENCKSMNSFSISGEDFLVRDKKQKDAIISIRIRPDYLVFADMLVPQRKIQKGTFLVQVRKKRRSRATRRTSQAK